MSTQLNQYIEHTILRPDTNLVDIDQICNEAMLYDFAGVCVPPYYVAAAAEILAEAPVEIITVVGFPYGYSCTMAKLEELEDAIRKGANHLDVVINIAAVKNNDWETVENEIETLTRLTHLEGRIIKIIAETGLMSDIELDLICKIANNAGIDYLKTSTGINGTGATVETIQTIRELLEPSIKIKASGGIRTKEFASELIESGANRIGASKSVEMMK